jgi:septum formation protein
MLDAAGVTYTAVPARVDEDGVKAAMAGQPARDIADALAELKALKVSQAHPAALVLGSDSIVALADGRLLDKPTSRDEAADHLRAMSSGEHALWSAAVIAEQGRPVWRHVERCPKRLSRPISTSNGQRFRAVSAVSASKALASNCSAGSRAAISPCSACHCFRCSTICAPGEK